MVNIPIELIEKEARRDGLKGNLNIAIKARLSNGYNPRTRTITIRPYKKMWRMAQLLAHEIKHQIDLEGLPTWVIIISYWPVILAIGVAAGFWYGWLWSFLGFFGAYVFHPFEISANWYAIRNWRRYYNVLKSLE